MDKEITEQLVRSLQNVPKFYESLMYSLISVSLFPHQYFIQMIGKSHKFPQESGHGKALLTVLY